MKRMETGRRAFALAATTVLLAGCQIIPKAPGPATPMPTPTPKPEPSATQLPTDQTRHRVALLVPLSGRTGAVGQSIANATTMALLDTNADNIRITTYDTATGARDAAAKAVADGNKLILGPLLGANVPAVQAEARTSGIPIVSFSNDTRIASPDVFVMGHIPEQSVERSVRYVRAQGANNFAAIVPNGDYGQRAEAALTATLRRDGGNLIATERYDRGNTSITSAGQRLATRGGFDTVLIADGAELATQAARQVNANGNTRILGTELWSGEAAVTRSAALRGALFAAVPDARYRRFSESYESRFGEKPYRISTLGYDAVLLTLRVARDWKVGRVFPTNRLRDEGGFLGLDGSFRFASNGVVQRMMEVRQVRDGNVVVVDAAPTSFGN